MGRLNIVLCLGIMLVLGMGVGSVGAVECNADLSQGGNSCTVSSTGTFTLDGLPHNINSSGQLGAIRITHDDVDFNCNGSVIYGNKTIGGDSTDDSRAFFFNGAKNITLRNCIIKYYNIGYLPRNTLDNIGSKVINVTFDSNRIGFNAQNVSNINITSSIFTNNWFYDMYIYLDNNILIDGNNFSNMNLTSLKENGVNKQNIFIEGGSNHTVSNNYFLNYSTNLFSKSYGISNLKIYNNYLLNSLTTSGFQIINTTNVNVRNNTIDKNAKGIYLGQSQNIIIENNTILNSITNYDEWNMGIVAEGEINNITIRYNNITNVGSCGILLKSTNNSYVYGNYINRMSDSEQILNNVDGQSDFSCGIGNVQLYYTFAWYPATTYSDPNISVIPYSYNMQIYNNTFGSNIQTYLYLQGVFNVTHDLSNFWYRSFQSPTYLVEKTELFNNLAYSKLSNVRSGVYNEEFGQGYGSSYVSLKMLFNVSQNSIYFRNRNLTQTYDTIVFNLSNALLYNTNGSTYGSTNINDNDGNINITLPPNNATYVLDNFNLTEGVSRQHSPLWFSSSSSSSKHIASNLSEAVNVSVSFNVDSCDSISRITYTSDTGAYTNTWISSDARTLCSGSVVTIPSVYIEPAVASNEFDIDYGCTTYEKIAYPIIRLAAVIVLLAGMLAYIYFRGGLRELGVAEIIVLFIVVMISLGFIQAIADTLAGRCLT